MYSTCPRIRSEADQKTGSNEDGTIPNHDRTACCARQSLICFPYRCSFEADLQIHFRSSSDALSTDVKEESEVVSLGIGQLIEFT